MTLGNEIGIEGFRVQLSVDGVTFSVVGKGNPAPTFEGIINPLSFIDPDLPLGSDLREYSTIEVLNEDLTPEIFYADKVQDEGGSVYKIVKREANPSDYVTRFWAISVVGFVDH